MTAEDAEAIFTMAANNAMLYGIGIIKMTNTPTGIVVDVIQPEEYLAVSDALRWASENSVRMDQ